MTNESQPLDRRQQQIADLRELVDFLDTHPDLPISGALGDYCIDGDDDTAGLAELRRVAAILDAEITTNGPGTHHYVSRRFGTVGYRAFYILREHMVAYDIEQEAKAKLRTCACGGRLSDADLIAGKKRCAACVPGEVKSKHDNGFRAPEVVAELEREDPTAVES